MRFVVLGPVRALRSGVAEPAGGVRERFVLASLLVYADRPVSADGLVDQLWAVPPDTARAQLHNLVSRLRRKLDPDGSGLIVTRPGAYELRLAGHELDLLEFRSAVRAAADAADGADSDGGDAEVAYQRIGAALDLWRGPAFADLPAELLRNERALLTEEWYAAREQALAAGFALGRYAEVVERAEELLGEEPYRERALEWAMLAHSAAGRPAEAVRLYDRADRLFTAELGVEPGAALRELRRRLSAGVGSGSAGPSSAASPPRPRQLPPPSAALTGRDKLVEELTAQLREPGGSRVAVLAGPGGVGKTTLALTVAHELASTFPDGQLYAELRGSSANPVDPHDVAARFLRALGAGQDEIPEARDERLTALRDRLAGTRALIVMDDAGAEEQVRPLLPAIHAEDSRPAEPAEPAARSVTGASGGTSEAVGSSAASASGGTAAGSEVGGSSAAGAGGVVGASGVVAGSSAFLVTSRYQLAGLAGADHRRVPLLSSTSAIDLLRRIAGGERVLAEPDAAEAIVAACGRLPLAVSVAAARLAVEPEATLAELGERLGAERGRLDELRVGDLDVRATIGLSYEQLSPPARQLFRRLGLATPRSTDWPEWVAAELLESPDPVRTLDELVDAHLLEPLGHDVTGGLRFRMHDLVADVARERADLDDEPGRLRYVQEQLLSRWLGAAAQADEYVSPDQPFWHALVHEGLPDPPAELGGVLREHPRDWFETEWACLLAAVGRAAELGRADLAGRLALSLTDFASIRNYLDDKERALTVAIGAARAAAPGRDADELLGSLLGALSTLRAQQNAYAELRDLADEQRAIARRLADPAMELRAIRNAAFAAACVGTLVEAGQLVDDGLELAREGELPGVTALLVLRADLHNDVGEYAQAVRLFGEALPDLRSGGGTRRLAIGLSMYANLLTNAGDHAEATAVVAEARKIAADLGDELGLAHLALNDAEIDVAAGRLDTAERALRQARRQLDRMDDRLGLAAVFLTEGDLHTRRGDLVAARAALEQSLAIRREMRTPLQIGRLLARLERVHRAAGRPAEADECHAEWTTTYAGLNLDERALQLPAYYP
ncbi:AfsR/SARP family transcriptional regulator [Flindersiella endophytica]